MSYRLSALAFCAVFAVASVCQASLGPLQIKLDDGSNTIVIEDGGAGDTNPADGEVSIIEALGVWTTNISSGVTAPSLGTTSLPEMDLVSYNATSNSAGTMTVSITAKYVPNSPVIGGFYHTIGGTTSGTVSTSLYIGTSAFDESTQITSMTPSLLGVAPTFAFSDQTQGGDDGMDEEYWLTLTADVEHTSAGSTSFNAKVDPIPEPASIAIWTLMAGIGGLIWMRRRSK